jgi:hypothetical protein
MTERSEVIIKHRQADPLAERRHGCASRSEVQP